MRGRVVGRERGRVSGAGRQFWAESSLGGLAPAAPSSRCCGWDSPGSFIPGLGTPCAAPSEPFLKSLPEDSALPPFHYAD